MKKSLLAILSCFLFVFYAGCGRKGVLQEPVPKLPKKVEDFTVIQRGGRIFFSWTNPVSYIDGSPLEIVKIEIRALEFSGAESSHGPGKAEFSRQGRLLSDLKIGQLQTNNNRAILNLDLGKTIGQKFVFGLRVKGRKGDWSEFSNLVELAPLLLPLPPEGLKTECFENRIVLSWQPPDYFADRKSRAIIIGFNIYRSTEGDFQKLNASVVDKPVFEDRNFSFGQTYRYLVRAVSGNESDLRESEDSEILGITPRDIFPPEPPAEVQAIVSGDGIRLSWLPNQENDLAGYRVYRLKEGESRPLLLTAELLPNPVFYDSSVEKNCLYVYSITSVDKSGNESPPGKIQVRT
jgi:hypothetical protein